MALARSFMIDSTDVAGALDFVENMPCQYVIYSNYVDRNGDPRVLGLMLYPGDTSWSYLTGRFHDVHLIPANEVMDSISFLETFPNYVSHGSHPGYLPPITQTAPLVTRMATIDGDNSHSMTAPHSATTPADGGLARTRSLRPIGSLPAFCLP